ncbi:S53 family peptidase [Dictyobacter alpinus]|uniref:S53 family peptidase n=1 Tax=Dictyobacter alpinus TaxID=2014873 RepID=UPI0013871868|nr:S53 family peptidase [Dictyobacter alpinus]
MSSVTGVSVRHKGSGPIGALTHATKGMYLERWKLKSPPADADCRKQMQMSCYSPNEIRTAYGINTVLKAGYTGAGETIVIVDSFGSPDPVKDLHQFDVDYGLPDPPSFKVLHPLGAVKFDANNTDQVGWAQETNLDIQWAHVIAPGANIVLLTSPVSETQGVQGLPEFLKLEQYALNHHLGKIFSQSWGATEETLFTPEGKKVLNDFEKFYQQASKQGVTFLASAGDTGASNPDTNNNTYPFPTIGFPANSPLVTSVGGTSLFADTAGNYQSEMAWNQGVGSSTGGGYSRYYKAPYYQQKYLSAGAKSMARGFRGVPDVAFNGDPLTSVPVYLGFMPQPGYYMFGGTSAGAPQWAGLIADANQMARHPLGSINETLYRIGSDPVLYARAFNDITFGDNTQGKIKGYKAGAGWDAVTGWGTPKANILLPLLVNPPK